MAVYIRAIRLMYQLFDPLISLRFKRSTRFVHFDIFTFSNETGHLRRRLHNSLLCGRNRGILKIEESGIWRIISFPSTGSLFPLREGKSSSEGARDRPIRTR